MLRAIAETPSAPLGEPARRFLRPLVGIDPAAANVREGPLAGAAAEERAADALAVGPDILVPPGSVSETPESLGLLAHELTHVARQHAPTFVPPVLSPAPEPARSDDVPQEAARSAAPTPTAQPASGDEEGVAQATERAVRGVARSVGTAPPAARTIFAPPAPREPEGRGRLRERAGRTDPPRGLGRAARAVGAAARGG